MFAIPRNKQTFHLQQKQIINTESGSFTHGNPSNPNRPKGRLKHTILYIGTLVS